MTVSQHWERRPDLCLCDECDLAGSLVMLLGSLRSAVGAIEKARRWVAPEDIESLQLVRNVLWDLVAALNDEGAQPSDDKTGVR